MSRRDLVIRSIHRTVAATMFAAALLSVSAQEPVTLRKAALTRGPDGRPTRLELTFDKGVSAVSVRSEPWGVSVSFPGIVDPAGGVDLPTTRTGVETVLRVERMGAYVRAVLWSGSVVDVELATAAGAVPSVAEAAASPDLYRIGVGDVLNVMVYKNPEMTADYTVASDGNVTIPLAGALTARGLSEAEFAALIRERLNKFIVDPQVTVAIKTYQSQWVHVTGNVSRPTRVALRPGMTVNDVLSEANASLLAGQRAIITREGGKEIAVLDREAIESGRAPEPRDGDVITVDEVRFIFINGEVRRPQRVAYSEGLTLLQAIAVAEGLTDWASKKEVRIRRASGSGTEDIVVDLRKIEDGKAEDPHLKPGDVILVKRRFL